MKPHQYVNVFLYCVVRQWKYAIVYTHYKMHVHAVFDVYYREFDTVQPVHFQDYKVQISALPHSF